MCSVGRRPRRRNCWRPRWLPGPKQKAPVEAVAAAPGPKERLLHRILALVERGEHAVAVDVQFAAMTLGVRGELCFVDVDGGHVGHAVCSALFTSWTSQLLPSGSLNERNVL